MGLLAWETTAISCRQPRYPLFDSFGSVFAARTTARDQPHLQQLFCSTPFAAPFTLAQHLSRDTCLATRKLLHLYR
jgi:hypothetical protein